MKHKLLAVILLIGLIEGCQQPTVKEQEEIEKVTPYKEPYRPQYHFSPPSQWMNDPNGMVYFEGEYHLFYQHYPDSNVWGPMHWGHAVSKDLVKWENLPIALYPDSLGHIFSGSAVIDWENTSGLGTADTPAMVAIFSHHDMTSEQAGAIDYQYQSIAFSLDKGRTWEKYAENPVLGNPGIKDFRDPKVFWSDQWNKWIMSLAVKDHINFYGSENLLEWEKLSEFGATIGAHGGVWECPDLFPLTDQYGNTKWVLLVSINPGGPHGGSATQYFVGDFDGTTFKPIDKKVRWIDYGADNYAGVTYADIPDDDGRRLFVGWMSNWLYGQAVPTKEWRSAMTIPRALGLKKVNNDYLLTSKPIDELKRLRGTRITLVNGSNKLYTPRAEIEVEFDAPGHELIFSNKLGEQLIIALSDSSLTVDRTKAGDSSFNSEFAATHSASTEALECRRLKVFLDDSSVEVFINDGELVMTELVFPNEPYSQLTINGTITDGELYQLKPIW